MKCSIKRRAQNSKSTKESSNTLIHFIYTKFLTLPKTYVLIYCTHVYLLLIVMYNSYNLRKKVLNMKIAKIIAWLGVIAMTVALLNGLINGSFFDDGNIILNNPWGIVSLVDLYVGFILFALWIIFREKSIMSIIIWVTLLMVLGFFIGSLYVLIKLYQSKNDYLTFFLGSKKDQLLKDYYEKTT